MLSLYRLIINKKHYSPITLTDISFINLDFIFRCSSSPSNPMYESRVDFSVLVFSLSSNRHSYQCFFVSTVRPVGSLPRPLCNEQFFCLCSTLQRCLGFFGQLLVLERTPQQYQPPRTGWWVSSQPFEFLTKTTRVSGLWFVPTSSLPFSVLSICPTFEESCSRERMLGQGIFFSFPTNTGGIVDVCDTLTSELMFR